MSKESDVKLAQKFNEQARSYILEATRIQEDNDHRGQPCFNERCHTIAFLCHSLQLKPEHFEQIGKSLAEFDRRHHEHSTGDEPP